MKHPAVRFLLTAVSHARGRLRGVARAVTATRRARVISAAAVGVVLTGAAAPVVLAELNSLPDDAAFRVHDTVVTAAELEQRMTVLEALYGIRQPAGGEKLEQFRRDAAKAAAVSLVLDRAAAERRIDVSKKAARDALTTMIEDRYGARGRARFIDLLSRVGASESDVLDEIRRQRRIEQLFTQVTEKAVSGVTDAVVRRHYADHPGDMLTQEQRQVRNIVVADKAGAQRLLRQIRAGASFTALARKHSLDDSTRNNGGNLGRITQTMLDDAYATAAFATPAGGTFGPVRTEHGWNVGQIVTITKPRGLKLAEIQDELRESLRANAATKAWRTWLTAQLRAADVEYADEYQPSDPYAPPGPATSGQPAAKPPPRSGEEPPR